MIEVPMSNRERLTHTLALDAIMNEVRKGKGQGASVLARTILAASPGSRRDFEEWQNNTEAARRSLLLGVDEARTHRENLSMGEPFPAEHRNIEQPYSSQWGPGVYQFAEFPTPVPLDTIKAVVPEIIRKLKGQEFGTRRIVRDTVKRLDPRKDNMRDASSVLDEEWNLRTHIFGGSLEEMHTVLFGLEPR